MPATPNPPAKTRILFFAEAVTLAHVARPIALAQALDSELFDVHLAHHPRYRGLLGRLDLREHRINSISPQQFMQALAKGRPLYDEATLSAYVEEDLKLIAAIEPDIIVGDFRLSLAVSAELGAIPYIALSNAYWSPYVRQRYTVPDLPMARILGPSLAQPIFSLARPLVFALHCLPMNSVRRRYGQDSLGFNLGRVYTHGNYTLYADTPDLFRMHKLPHNHRFIGPVTWSPELPLPPWWQQLPQGAPVVYVSLGSSGQARLLPELIAALERLDVTALVSTAGAPLPASVPENVYLAEYLPGDEVIKMASLVICNGGSLGTHQALAQGVPVIGLAGNLDQFLNMAAIEQTGAGKCLRADRCDSDALHRLIARVLADPATREGAGRIAAHFADLDSSIEFNRIVREIAPPQGHRKAD